MTSLPVEEPPTITGFRLRIKYNRTTIVLNILIKKVMHCLVAVVFVWDTLYLTNLERGVIHIYNGKSVTNTILLIASYF